jgi:hypothetical protein
MATSARSAMSFGPAASALFVQLISLRFEIFNECLGPISQHLRDQISTRTVDNPRSFAHWHLQIDSDRFFCHVTVVFDSRSFSVDLTFRQIKRSRSFGARQLEIISVIIQSLLIKPLSMPVYQYLEVVLSMTPQNSLFTTFWCFFVFDAIFIFLSVFVTETAVCSTDR